MNQINQQIGHKIKGKRKKLGITQADLSKRLSISPTYLNLMESGKRKIGLDFMVKISNELNVDISDISNKDILYNSCEIEDVFPSFFCINFSKSSSL